MHTHPHEHLPEEQHSDWLRIHEHAHITEEHHGSEIPQRQVGDPRYLRLLDELRELHLSKSHDYGFKDPLANLRAAEEFGIPPWVGCLLRANDKVTRIKSFIQSGTLKHESVEDSLMDIAAYALLALVLVREEANEL